MSKPELHVKYQLKQLFRLDRLVYQMGKEGIPELSTPFNAVLEARGLLQRNLGYRVPRTVFSLLKLFGLSPGTITLWFDAELGFMTTARSAPGAPLVTKNISDETGMRILKGELTHELEKLLLTPTEPVSH